MIKVVLWDYTGDSAEWAKYFLKDDVEIIRTLKPDDKDQAEFILRGDWDYVLIFEQGSREVFDEILNTIRAMNFPTENIIFAQDTQSWVKNSTAIFALIDIKRGEIIYRGLNFFNHRKWHNYASCTAEGLSYVATSKDDVIITTTYMYGKNHAADEMKIFHALAKKYYSVDDSAGYFLDLGANIGTTGIYFTSKLAPNLKLLAFEPDAENFKLLRVNLILNDLDNKSIAVNCGLGDKFDTMTMYRSLQNPGGNGVFTCQNNMPTAQIKIMPLDSYLAEKKISAREVKYIWIDTEGFEAQVLLGAKNLLSENPAPVFMEFNPMMWNKSGRFEEMIALLKTVGYTNYIWIPELLQTGEDRLHALDELWAWRDSNYWIGDLGDIFLVK